MPRFPVAAVAAEEVQFNRVAYTGDGQASKIVDCGFKPRLIGICHADNETIQFIVTDEDAHLGAPNGWGTSWWQRTGVYLTDTGVDVAKISSDFGCNPGLNTNANAYVLIAIG